MNNIKEAIIEYYADTEDILFADGFDSAIIGFDPNLWKVVYSRQKCIEVLQQGGMTYEEAIQDFEYNTLEAYVGEKTPIWVEGFESKV